MMVSRTAEYALRAAVYLATRQGEPATIAEIATATQAPANYLAKVLRQMSRSQLVAAQRGVQGGFTLRQAPSDIPVLAIIGSVDPTTRIEKCPLGIANHQQLCPLHQRLDNAAKAVEDTFRETSLAVLANESAQSACPFPCQAPGDGTVAAH